VSRKGKKITLGVLVLSAFLLLLGACEENKTETASSSAASSGNTELRLDVVSTGTQAIPAYIMQKYNLAEKYGINLSIHNNSGAWGSEWTAIKTGEVDAIITAWTYVQMNYRDFKTKSVAPMFGWGNSVIAPVDSNIKSLEDLRGIKLGVYQTTALDWVLLNAAADKKYGFDLSKENEISEAAAGLLGGMLEQGNIDAALSYADTNVILSASGKYKTLFSSEDVLDILGLSQETPFLFYTFSEDYYKAHPETVASFVKMYEEVYNILMSDDAVWADIAKDCFGVNDEAAVPILRDTLRSCILYKNTPETLKQCKDMLAWCIENGYEDMLGISELSEDFLATF